MYKRQADKKIKREKDEELTLHLRATHDIAASLGAIKRKQQCLVGFALETNNEQQNAEGKLERKNFDFIVLNSCLLYTSILYFRRKAGEWELYKFEDTSIWYRL